MCSLDIKLALCGTIRDLKLSLPRIPPLSEMGICSPSVAMNLAVVLDPAGVVFEVSVASGVE